MRSLTQRSSLISAFFVALVTLISCVPQGGTVKPVDKPALSVRNPTAPAAAPGAPQTVNTNPATGCPAGSEAAIPELRNCCRERNWGKACDGGCWQAGVGEKLSQMCNGNKTAASDCSQSPAKTNTSEWCSFHYNRRYCGVSDSEWISTCKTGSTGATPSTPSSPGNDCNKSPAKTQTNDWCNFHYNRRYCGISDSEWVQTCTPSSSTAVTPTPVQTTNAGTTASCKTTQNRGFPYPPCPQRKSEKLCKEGPEGRENGRYCVWTVN